MNVLESLRSFYKFALGDQSRNGVALRKILLEAVSGVEIRTKNQLTELADILGARRKFMSEMCQARIKSEENQVLSLLVDRIARKAPEGGGIISKEWKMKAGSFYEGVSDIVKGHHAVYKVIVLVNLLAFSVASWLYDSLCKHHFQQYLGIFLIWRCQST